MAYNHDPYENEISAVGESIYIPGIGYDFTLSISFIFFLLLAGLVLITDWGFLKIFLFSLAFLQGFWLFYSVRRIHYKNKGLRILYWFRPSKLIQWSEVSRIRVKFGRGLWTYIYTNNRSIFAVKFHVGNFVVHNNAKLLIKTSIERAGLPFVKGNHLGEADYIKTIAT
jgi:hypothetical protein